MWAVSSQLYLCTSATCLFFPVYLSWCDIPCACPICGQKEVLQNQSDLSLKPSYRFFKGNISLSLPYCEHFLFKKTNPNDPNNLTSKLCVQYVLWNFICICSRPWVAQFCRSTRSLSRARDPGPLFLMNHGAAWNHLWNAALSQAPFISFFRGAARLTSPAGSYKNIEVPLL